MKYSRVLSIAITLVAAMLASGCMSIPAPSVRSQTGMAEPSGDAKPNVLLVLHVSLQRKAYPSETAKRAETVYDPVGQAFVKRVEALGGKADYKVFSETSDFEIPQAGYTHVLVERITQMRIDGQGVSHRTWDATLWVMDTSPARRAAKKVFTQVYDSNGVFCFTANQYANKVECQVQYIDHLVAHMAPVLPVKPLAK